MTKQAGIEHSELKTLVELSSLINSSLDTQTVLENAMRCIQVFLDAEAGSIFELDKAGEELFFRTILGDAAEKVKGVRLKLGEGIAGWVAKTRKPLLVQDVRKDPRFCSVVDARTGFQTRSILCVPLICKGELLGVAQVLNKKGDRSFDENDLEVLTILCNQIAIALENARLYTRLSEKFTMATEELKVAQERLIRSERLAALGKLSQGIAHEVRNPVMVIGGFAHRLKKQFAASDSVSNTLEIIIRATERLERMVSNIEKLSKLRRPVPQPVKLPALIENVLQDLRPFLEAQRIEVKQNFHGEVLNLEADEELLELALRNIVLNAIEAMPKGGTLEVDVASQPDGLHISVRDGGVGVPSDQLPNIFDPFFTTKTCGSGLGLATVHRIISDHSGDVKVSSVQGKGTEVQVRLPYRWAESRALF